MSKCRCLTPCGICEINSMTGIPYRCDLMQEEKTYADKGKRASTSPSENHRESGKNFVENFERGLKDGMRGGEES